MEPRKWNGSNAVPDVAFPSTALVHANASIGEKAAVITKRFVSHAMVRKNLFRRRMLQPNVEGLNQ
jgi:hypothetical protein